jgi:hypothetical protein
MSPGVGLGGVVVQAIILRGMIIDYLNDQILHILVYFFFTYFDLVDTSVEFGLVKSYPSFEGCYRAALNVPRCRIRRGCCSGYNTENLTMNYRTVFALNFLSY